MASNAPPDREKSSVPSSCLVCMRKLEKCELGKPESCEHFFCFTCLFEWSKNVNTCPVDRLRFNLIEVYDSQTTECVRKVSVPDRCLEQVLVDPYGFTYCEVCGECTREDTLLLCDGCDKGYHLECLDPPLDEVPDGNWYCCQCEPIVKGVSELGTGVSLITDNTSDSSEEDTSSSSDQVGDAELQPESTPSEADREDSVAGLVIGVVSGIPKRIKRPTPLCQSPVVFSGGSTEMQPRRTPRVAPLAEQVDSKAGIVKGGNKRPRPHWPSPIISSGVGTSNEQGSFTATSFLRPEVENEVVVLSAVKGQSIPKRQKVSEATPLIDLTTDDGSPCITLRRGGFLLDQRRPARRNIRQRVSPPQQERPSPVQVREDSEMLSSTSRSRARTAATGSSPHVSIRQAVIASHKCANSQDGLLVAQQIAQGVWQSPDRGMQYGRNQQSCPALYPIVQNLSVPHVGYISQGMSLCFTPPFSAQASPSGSSPSSASALKCYSSPVPTSDSCARTSPYRPLVSDSGSCARTSPYRSKVPTQRPSHCDRYQSPPETPQSGPIRPTVRHFRSGCAPELMFSPVASRALKPEKLDFSRSATTDYVGEICQNLDDLQAKEHIFHRDGSIEAVQQRPPNMDSRVPLIDGSLSSKVTPTDGSLSSRTPPTDGSLSSRMTPTDGSLSSPSRSSGHRPQPAINSRGDNLLSSPRSSGHRTSLLGIDSRVPVTNILPSSSRGHKLLDSRVPPSGAILSSSPRNSGHRPSSPEVGSSVPARDLPLSFSPRNSGCRTSLDTVSRVPLHDDDDVPCWTSRHTNASHLDREAHHDNYSPADSGCAHIMWQQFNPQFQESNDNDGNGYQQWIPLSSHRCHRPLSRSSSVHSNSDQYSCTGDPSSCPMPQDFFHPLPPSELSTNWALSNLSPSSVCSEMSVDEPSFPLPQSHLIHSSGSGACEPSLPPPPQLFGCPTFDSSCSIRKSLREACSANQASLTYEHRSNAFYRDDKHYSPSEVCLPSPLPSNQPSFLHLSFDSAVVSDASTPPTGVASLCPNRFVTASRSSLIIHCGAANEMFSQSASNNQTALYSAMETQARNGQDGHEMQSTPKHFHISNRPVATVLPVERADNSVVQCWNRSVGGEKVSEIDQEALLDQQLASEYVLQLLKHYWQEGSLSTKHMDKIRVKALRKIQLTKVHVKRARVKRLVDDYITIYKSCEQL